MEYRPISRRPVVAAIVVLALSAVVGLGASAAVHNFWGPARARSIQVTDTNVFTAQVGSPEEAMRIASDKAGFPVYSPGFVPAGLELQSINIEYGPEDLPNRMTVVMLLYQSPKHGVSAVKTMAITQINVRTERPANYYEDPVLNTNERIDVNLPDAEVWRSGYPPRLAYTVWVGDRTYYVVVEGQQPDTNELAAIVRTFRGH